MSKGSGDLYAIVFEAAGVFLYGFDHESEATPWRSEDREHWPGLLEGVPASLVHWTTEPAFLFDGFFDATVCAWREAHDSEWCYGPVEFDDPSTGPDGAEWLFGTVVEGTAAAYADYARDYFERDVAIDAVAQILKAHPLTEALVASPSPQAEFSAVARAAVAAGYPVDGLSWLDRPVLRTRRFLPQAPPLCLLRGVLRRGFGCAWRSCSSWPVAGGRRSPGVLCARRVRGARGIGGVRPVRSTGRRRRCPSWRCRR